MAPIDSHASQLGPGVADSLSLIVHRSAAEIGGNCIELRVGGARLLLDIGRPLTADPDVSDRALLPDTLDTRSPVAALVISHPHQDHYGLLSALPAEWPIWCGGPTEALMRVTGKIARAPVKRGFHNYRSFEPFEAGPFRVTPFLTDHSAADAHMLLIEAAGRRVLYTGDFRVNGRKAALPERLMRDPPRDVDVLLMEGTTLGRTEAYPTEDDLEGRFLGLMKRTPGRVFVTWSAQNLDRTVTLYRAAKRGDRTLVIDIYTADVLRQLGRFRDSLPQPGWPNLKVVLTSRMRWLYSDQLDEEEFVTRVCAPNGMGAAALSEDRQRWVVMTRPSLAADFRKKGVTITPEDAWSYSQWRGYLSDPATQEMSRWFEAGGAHIEHIHTSGHAAPVDLKRFAAAIAPRHLVPIHSFKWDDHQEEFANIKRIRDGVPKVLPSGRKRGMPI